MDLLSRPTTKFHPYHGKNIQLLDEGAVAYREASFSHGVCFSEKPLFPGEIFLIEIERNERGWSGHLRIGLTTHNPHTRFELPQYALPDLAKMGNAWIFAVTKSQYHNRVYADPDMDPLWEDELPEHASILGDGDFIKTSRGPISSNLLQPAGLNPPPGPGGDTDPTCQPSTKHEDGILPTDTGSRIGIVYITKDNKAELHFLINGEDQGVCAKDIPYEYDKPLYVVVDVYGTTKQVRIVQLYPGICSLQNICRDMILQCIRKDQSERLPLPNKLKEFLRYEVF